MKTKSTTKLQIILALICITIIYVTFHLALITNSSTSIIAKANLENEKNNLSEKSMNGIDFSSINKQNTNQISRDFSGDFSMLNQPEATYLLTLPKRMDINTYIII